jgi:hypothetical protein
MPDAAASTERAGPVGARVFRLVVGVVLAAAALKLARPVLVPLVAGIFLAVTARPAQRRVAALLPRRLRGLGLLAAMLLVLGGIAAFGGALYLSGRAVAGELRDRARSWKHRSPRPANASRAAACPRRRSPHRRATPRRRRVAARRARPPAAVAAVAAVAAPPAVTPWAAWCAA